MGLAGVQKRTIDWLVESQIPFVSSWGGLTFFNHDLARYCGQIGVYGNRGANFILQNCDALIVLGSRLDNRQRSNNRHLFATGATVHVLDIDQEELKIFLGVADLYITPYQNAAQTTSGTLAYIPGGSAAGDSPN